MPRRLQIIAVVLLPVAVVAALLAVDRWFGPASRGRDYVVRIALPPAGGMIGLPRVEGPPDASRPLVVIDAGHGGRDPGASNGPVVEKTVTLALARAVRDELLKDGGVRVALTRSDDRFMVLQERSGIARRLGADLFLSIHADSVDNDTARGASVYTLSGKGSNEAAARIAAKENRADIVNGVALDSENDSVTAILVDLSQDDTHRRSRQFAQLILREFPANVRLHDRDVQSAAFVVLKSPDLPSVLFESGFVSNADDAVFLTSDEGRRALSSALARAIRIYFARQSRAAG
ncbi:MAG: N-acetylmuramoyl-L-alanine amidase [Novosphingobium sp.]|nr:N-acetylmuramoyl-L-alanine amidase [Novosphingobium sp.]